MHHLISRMLPTLASNYESLIYCAEVSLWKTFPRALLLRYRGHQPENITIADTKDSRLSKRPFLGLLASYHGSSP